MNRYLARYAATESYIHVNVQTYARVKRKPFFALIKRSFDVFASGMGILIFLMPMAVIAVIVKCTSPGPVLFRQRKLGRDKESFTMLKFRSMRIDAPHDVPTAEFKNSREYITKVGKFLRKSSLDELPQLFNIFAGQMSVIGPRPALESNEPLIVYLRDLNGANSIRPGLTGWAQVNGRDGITMHRKAFYDGDYAKNRGLWLDLKIFMLTVSQVFGHKGVVEGGPQQEVATAEYQLCEIGRIERERAMIEAAATIDEPERVNRKQERVVS